MKKILFYIASLVAMAACNKAAFDESIPEIGGHKVTVTVSTEEKIDTRVSYDDDWITTWDEGDELLAFYEGDKTGKFSMDKYDATCPTFTGDDLSVKYNLIYPYSIIDNRVSSDEPYYALDLTTQRAGAKQTYLISEKMIEPGATETKVKMVHIGATMVIEMKFTGYDGYTIGSLEVRGLNSMGAIQAPEEFGSDNLLLEPTPKTITITDIATLIDQSKDGIAKVRFNILPTTIAAGGEVRVNAYLTGSDGTTVALTKTITTERDIEFDRAKYHTIKCGFSSSDVISYDDDDLWIEYAKYYDNAVGGSTEDNPYEISTPEQLAYIAYDVNRDDQNTYEGKYFKLTNDIDLSGHKWVAIGQYFRDPNDYTTKFYKFKGTFDGAGHKITGVYINEETNNQSQGLFGYIEGATIKNLSVSGYVKSNNKIGGIVGWNNGSTITNCYNNVSLNGSKHSFIGGVVGYIENNGIITNCRNNGSVNSADFSRVGGVVASASNSNITNCHNSGYVGSGVNSFIGGVVGEAFKIAITNCYNNGSVKCGSNCFVGGIVANGSNSTITNCYNIGSIKIGNACLDGSISGSGSNNIFTNCYWDNTKYNTGIQGSATQNDVKGMNPEDMKELSFVSLLNNNATNYNETATIKACAWVSVVNGFPALDFDRVPVTD